MMDAAVYTETPLDIILIVVLPCIFDKYKIILPTNAPFIKT